MVIMVTVLYPETFSTVCKKMFLKFAPRLKMIPNDILDALILVLTKTSIALKQTCRRCLSLSVETVGANKHY